MERFTLKKRSERTDTCSIELLSGTFTVTVRQIIPTEDEEIRRRCSTRRPASGGGMENKLDADRYVRELADAMVVGWDGLTVANVRDIGLHLDDEGALQADAAGVVPYDQELAQQLFLHGYSDKFFAPCRLASTNMERQERTEKDALLGNSVA